jgi:hypothetical protein
MRSTTWTLVIAITLGCLLGTSSGQQRPKRKAVLVPPDHVLTTIANQPNCPLKFDKAAMILYVDAEGGGSDVYELRNHGSKAIRAYTAAVWTSIGAGNIVEQKIMRNGPVLPGEIAPQPGEVREVEIVPLTEDLRDKLKLRGPMTAVSVFIILRVEFEDGSVYSDERAFAALQEYFERVGASLVNANSK